MPRPRTFDLNIYDEQVTAPNISSSFIPEQYIFPDTDGTQRLLMKSEHLRNLSLALQKWKDVCEESSGVLRSFFRTNVGMEFGNKDKRTDFDPFSAGKYWQMVEYLDGRYLLQNKPDSKQARREYQDRLLFDMLGHGDLIQTGWDLAINSALMSDLMPNPRAKGSVYLLEKVAEDSESLFYSSITEDFHKRLANEAFWQTIFDDTRQTGVLEDVLTKQYEKLDPERAENSILRRRSQRRVRPKLLIGSESFQGVSPRALENLGSFLDKVNKTYKGNPDDLEDVNRAFVSAVQETDQDGIPYIRDEDKEKLLSYSFTNKLEPAK